MRDFGGSFRLFSPRKQIYIRGNNTPFMNKNLSKELSTDRK